MLFRVNHCFGMYLSNHVDLLDHLIGSRIWKDFCRFSVDAIPSDSTEHAIAL